MTHDTGPGRPIASLPKAHLHLHFTGSMRHTTLLELAERDGILLPDALVEDWPPQLSAADEKGWFRFQRLYDVARSVLELSADDSRTLSDLLGASQLTEAMAAVQQRIEGLTLEWIEVADGSSMARHSIGDGQLRTRTGASVVAVIRGDTSEPAPGPEFVIEPGDVVVAVGTADGLELLRQALRS